MSHSAAQTRTKTTPFPKATATATRQGGAGHVSFPAGEAGERSSGPIPHARFDRR